MPDDQIFDLLRSDDDGTTWSLEVKHHHSFWTIREARERSGKDKAKLYRVRNTDCDVTLITFREGMSVYDVP